MQSVRFNMIELRAGPCNIESNGLPLKSLLQGCPLITLNRST
jgi:hypothetical protein